MASLKEIMQKGKDVVEIGKAVGKRAFYNATGQDDKKVELPPETERRVRKSAGLPDKKEKK